MPGMSQRHQPPSILHHLFCLSLTTQIQKGNNYVFLKPIFKIYDTIHDVYKGQRSINGGVVHELDFSKDV